jgi:hypothetical protein
VTLEEAIAWMGPRYVRHPAYNANPPPWHNTACRYPGYDLHDCWKRVRARMAQQSQAGFADEVAKHRERLKLIHNRVVAK